MKKVIAAMIWCICIFTAVAVLAETLVIDGVLKSKGPCVIDKDIDKVEISMEGCWVIAATGDIFPDKPIDPNKYVPLDLEHMPNYDVVVHNSKITNLKKHVSSFSHASHMSLMNDCEGCHHFWNGYIRDGVCGNCHYMSEMKNIFHARNREYDKTSCRNCHYKQARKNKPHGPIKCNQCHVISCITCHI